MALDEDALREAVRHRGLKLIKSRKRKPGVGDFGRFGLTDASGAPLLGIGRDGLTASAQQVDDFLRKGEVSTWAESAKITPARAKMTAVATGPVEAQEGRGHSPVRPHRTNPPPDPEPRRRRDRTVRGEAEAPPPVSTPAPALELKIRPARPTDASTFVGLFSQVGIKVAQRQIERAIIDAVSRKEPILIAERGEVIGCLAWHILPTVQHGPVGRITALIVLESHRRRGVGQALYEAAAAELRKRKIDVVEAMSDIAVRNANGFYRALGLKEVSYRFSGGI